MNPNEGTQNPQQGPPRDGNRYRGKPRYQRGGSQGRKPRAPQPQNHGPQSQNHGPRPPRSDPPPPRQASQDNYRPQRDYRPPNQGRPRPISGRQPSRDPGYQSILNITNLFLIAILTGLIIFLIRILPVFGIFIFSFILAFLLYPSVDWLAKRRIPRVGAILIIYIIIGGALFAFLAMVVPTLVTQINNLIQQLPQLATNLQTQMTPKMQALRDILDKQGIRSEDIQAFMNKVVPGIQAWALGLGKRLAMGVQGAVGGIVASFSVPIIVFYLLMDAPKIRDSLMALAPKRTAREAEMLLSNIALMLNHYLRGQLKLCFIIFAFSTIGLLILGVPHALLLGLLAGITEIIPIVGPIIACIPATLIGMANPWDYGIVGIWMPNIWWVKGLVVVLFYLLMQWFENNLIVPRVMGKGLNVHPLTVMFALLAGGFLGGIAGMLMALPIAACLKVVFETYYTPFINRIEELISRNPAQVEATHQPQADSAPPDFGE
jgi:predicted PurR-regulated permease PerM